MITIVDEDLGEVIVCDGSRESCYPMGSAEGFAALSRAWLLAGWDAKYVYAFSWMGRPVIQLPEDLIRIQEVIYRIKPDVLLETGIAHGGSLVYYASLFRAMGRGRVIGIDVEIRPHNRRAIEAHELFPLITLIEGNSIAPETLTRARSSIMPDEKVMVLLDSKHTKDHVLNELRSYAPLVTVGSYIVAMDGIMEYVAGRARTQPDWTWNNPRQAVLAFAQEHPDFQMDEPVVPFNEGNVKERVTYWPTAFLQRVR